MERLNARVARDTRTVLARDGVVCQGCGGAPATQVDHVVPVIDGGNDGPANLRALCVACNLARR